MGRNSRKEPGQPCRRRAGMAFGLWEKRATKWIENVLLEGSWVGRSMSVTEAVYCGNELICVSCSRQEKLWRHSETAEVNHACERPRT